MKENKVEPESVQQTLFLPLWGRAVESKQKHPKLIDRTAEKIMDEVSFDFKKIEKSVNQITRRSWIARSIYFDNRIKYVLEKFPETTVVNFGCGLDTSFERVDNGKLTWLDIDFPDVIKLRQNYIKDTERRKSAAFSVFSDEWYPLIPQGKPVLFLMAGVIYFFREEEIRKLLRNLATHFGPYELLFDYCSVKGMELANRKIIEKSGMTESSHLVWGTDDIHETEGWNLGIEIIHDMPMFADFRKHYPFPERIGLILTDSMRIMSLCQLRVNHG